MSDTLKLSAALSGRYVVERELGAGGMATVYLARDVKHDREVALKVLRPELGAVLGAERFLAEIKITARLDHPHILTLIDSGQTDGFLWYVLPFIRGESLRDRLNREQQLGLDEALTITRQVASALDYAHRQGVVHRDIKPENILLHEGEAVLADFGIALAVKEAGGNRLTETGLSLGTPQYMSPEQATGDRQLDARSDLYSLAAVLYEMLAGEPPVTGPTVQAVIAKLLTERPARLRVVRDTVPEGIDNAVAKALAKVPADRYAGAAEFAAALQAPAPGASPGRGRGRVPLAWAAVAVVVVLAALAGWLVKGRGARGPAVTLGDRTQLTFSGAIQYPAVSPDGKQLAFVVKNCSGAGCTYAIDVQDVGGTATRRVLDGATAAYSLAWSPDRRNLIAIGTIGGRYGSFLVSAIGGTPRNLTSGAAAFSAGGDSLFVGPPANPDSVYWVRVTTLDGVVRDSLRVAGRGQGVTGLAAIPGTAWIVAGLQQGAHVLWEVMDRKGRVLDSVVNPTSGGYCGASADALWLARSGTFGSQAIVRVGLDPRTGRLASRQDTVFNGIFTAFSETADGSALVLDEGTYEYSVWALDVQDALHGRFSERARVLRSSTPVSADVSPDDRRLLVARVLPSAEGRSELRLSVMPVAGGAETPLSGPGTALDAEWADSVTVATARLTSRGLRFALTDVRTGAERNVLDLPDSAMQDFEPLPDGWAWIPAGGLEVIVRAGGRTREIAKPDWFNQLTNVSASPDGKRLAYTGWDAATYDSLRVDVVPVDGGAPERWAAHFGESGHGRFTSDGSVLFPVFGTQESVTLYRLTGPGREARIGTVPRPVTNFLSSRDPRLAAVLVRDYHGDAWMSRVVRH